MKIRKLIIHNIASIEDAVIDLDKSPLADSEVYLISGQTGAGKTTILDAIALALFGNTPRLAFSQMNSAVNEIEMQLSIKSPEQLLRRNTGEGFVTLTFDANDNTAYESTWYLARAHKRHDRKLQKVQMTLRNLNTGKEINRKKDVLNEIQNLIGLDFTQFCRTTMLAQGEFSKFLNSSDNEKAIILEKITGLSEYAEIGAAIYRLYTENKNIYLQAKQSLETITLLSDAEKEELEQKIAETEERRSLLKEKEKGTQTKKDWLIERENLAEALKKADENYERSVVLANSPDVITSVKLIDDWNVTSEVRTSMAEMANAEKRVAEASLRLEKTKEEYVFLLSSAFRLNDRIKSDEERLGKIQNSLSQYDPYKSVLAQSEKISLMLDDLFNERKTRTNCLKEIEENEKLLSDNLHPFAEKVKKEGTEIITKRKSLEEDIVKMENSKEFTSLAALEQQLKGLSDELSSLALCAQIYELIETTAKEIHTVASRLDDEKTKLISLKKEEEKCKDLCDSLQQEVDKAQAVYDGQKDTLDNFARQMRARLHPGDNCPVCRQIIKDIFDSEDDLRKLIEGYKKNLVEARNALKSAQEKKTLAVSAVKTSIGLISVDQDTLKAKEKVLESRKDKLKELSKPFGLESLAENGDSKIVREIEIREKTKRTVEDSIAIARKVADEIKERQKDIRKCSEILEKTLEQQRISTQKISITEEKIRNLKDRNLKSENKITGLEETLKGIIEGDWSIDWMTSPKEFIEILLKFKNEHDALSSQFESLVKNLDQSHKSASDLKNIIYTIKELMPQWGEPDFSEVRLPENFDALKESNRIIAEITSACDALVAAEKEIKEKQRDIDTFLSENDSINSDRLLYLSSVKPEDVKLKRELIDNVRSQESAAKAVKAQVAQSLNQHLQRKPEMEDSDTIESLGNELAEMELKIEEYLKEISSFGQILRSDKENREKSGKLYEDAEKKRIIAERWERLNRHLGDSTGSTFRKIAQSHVLQSLVMGANRYLSTLSGRYTLFVNPGEFTIMIEDSYQGYAKRSVATLSGGETFLVSLSLALALSEIGHRLAVDTLFIDEGFGSLSGEPLRNAIDTLRLLHTKLGRHVGIISHIEELKERIPVQIRVEQRPQSGVSTVTIIP